MSQYQDDFESRMYQPYEEEKPKRSWLGRNWFWFVPLIVLMPIFCCCGGGGLIVWWGIQEINGLPPYVDTITAAEQDPQVQQALGTPIEIDTIMGIPSGGQFDYNIDNNGEAFEAEIVLTGSASSGTLRIEASSPDGTNWTYTVREVELPDGTIIDLIPAGSGSPTDTTEQEAINAAVDVIKESQRELIPDQE